jgi:transcriptional regulator with GAF, ATPase, and Fis domain
MRRNGQAQLIGTSLPVLDLKAEIERIARSDAKVLVTGESGTGKELVAAAIHQASERHDQPLVKVNCAAIPETLLESELFGHERGAFTGAVKRKLGKFEIANGGTIFLDEVGVMTPAAQIKLLAVIQDRVFQRVGGEKDIEVDVRIIAASNVDLLSLCEAGQFRTDLYFRLNVFPMDIPPLRDRKEDIPSLLWTFIEQLQAIDPKEIEDIDPRVLDALIRYNWPGNVRELENLVERAFILENSPVLSPRSFPAELFRDSIATMGSGSTRLTLAQYRDTNLGILEKQYLDALLRKHHGRIDQTAAAAGVGVRQLHKLMIRHQLKRGDYVKQ